MNHSLSFSNRASVKILLWLTIFGLIIAGIAYLFNNIFEISTTPVFQAIERHKIAGLALYLLYAAFATIIIPIPTLPLDAALFSLNVFNPWLIFALRLVGDLIGTTVSFTLARRWGPALLQRLLSPSNYRETLSISRSVTPRQFFWIAMFPLLNTELVAYAAGLSRLRLTSLLGIIIVAVGYRLLFVLWIVSITH